MLARFKVTLKVAVILAFCEILIMLALPYLKFVSSDSLLEALLDSILLIIIATPIIYLFILAPLHNREKTAVHWKIITSKLAVIIFFNEILIMSVLFWIKPYFTSVQISIIDGISVAVLSAPLIYLWVIQRLKVDSLNRLNMGMLPYVVIFSMVVILFGLVFLGISGMETISGLRSYVGAEGIWSKSQKSAVVHLLRYADNKNEQDYKSFKNFLEVPQWNKKARLELEKNNPDIETALNALIQGGSHPDDVKTMAFLFKWFRNFDHIDRAINIWERGDQQIQTLESLGIKLHKHYLEQSSTHEEVEQIVKDIIFIDEVLTALEDEFSYTLGEATRWAKGLLFFLMYTSAIVAAIISIWLLLFVSKIFYNLQISNSTLSQKSIELQNLTITLEKRVAQRTKTLNDSLENIREIQNQLLESEKMASLGGLVAGVAHEINTPIGIGVTAASYLESSSTKFKKKFKKGQLKRSELESYLEDATESASLILNNLQRAAQLVKSFKQVAVDQSTHDFLSFNVNNHLSNILMSIRPVIKNSPYKINYDCPDNLKILGLPGAWSQIIINLVMNSLLHGFNGRDYGQIDIKIEQIKEHILLQYKDDGLGMDQLTKEKLFEAFFTTRRGQGGTGLGMHIVYNLVTKTLKGEIECLSSPGKGTTFKMTLPILSATDQDQIIP
ncbi:MAG: HAMP domain-containing histidine kinase [Magnetococcales bacterium]|nr:HAMP domain-containing histidine kinase [Magnetococcales bacterium]